MNRVSRLREQSGQAVIEFAAVMIPFAVMFMLALDGAVFFYGYVSAAHAVREGARCGVVGASVGNIQSHVISEIPGSAPTVTATRADSNSDGVTGVGDRITVSATWTYNWITPLSSFGIADGTTKTYTVKMRLETNKTDGPCG